VDKSDHRRQRGRRCSKKQDISFSTLAMPREIHNSLCIILSKFFARIKKPGAYLVLVITGASDDGSSGSQPIHRQVLVLVLQLFGLQLSLSLSWLLWGFLRCENYYSVPKLLA